MKQELLKWIDKNKVGRPSIFGLGNVETVYMDDLIEMINELEEPQVTYEQAWNKIAESYPETVQSLRSRLDHAVFGTTIENQNVKVPLHVGNWIEYSKDEGWEILRSIEEMTGPMGDGSVNRWVKNNSNKYANAWSNGFEVEESPKYSVIIAGEYLIKMYANKNTHMFVSEDALSCWHSSAYELTEKEIRFIDERYWPFAVPVVVVNE